MLYKSRKSTVSARALLEQDASMVQQLPIYGGRFLEKFSLKGRNIIITGGGSTGLNLTFADGLAQAGANIAIIDILDEPAAAFSALAYGGKYKYFRGDVTDYQALKTVIDNIATEFGPIYGCIAGAGIIRDKPFLEHTVADLEKTTAVNIHGVFYTIQLCAQKIKEHGQGGAIVAVASSAAHKSPAAAACSAYAASKYAVRGLIGQIAREMARYGIRVNTISPGSTRTELLQSVVDEYPERLKLFEDAPALGRVAEQEELCGMMLYLLSDLASFTTGQDFLIDGSSV